MAKHTGKGKGKASRYDSPPQPEDSDDEGTQQPSAKKARLLTSSNATPDRHKTASGSGHARSSSPYVNPFTRTSDATESSGSRRSDESAKAKGFKELVPVGAPKGHVTKPHAMGALARLAAASRGRDAERESEGNNAGEPQGGRDYIGGGAAALFSAKRVGDQFMNLRTKMEDLARDVRGQEANLEETKHQLHAMIGELESIDSTVANHKKELRTVLDGILCHEERIVSLESRLESALARLQDGGGASAPSRGVEEAPLTRVKREKERDNSLQDAVRKCLCCLMGIAFGGRLPLPCSTSGTYWERVYELNDQGTALDDAQSFLRPDWERPWTDNQSGWSVRVAARIQQRGHEYTSALSQEHLATLSRDTVIDAIRVVFISMAKRWKLENVSGGEQVKKARNIYAKSSNRKRVKAKSRREVSGKLPAAQAPEFAYQLQWQYQSSDESEIEKYTPIANDRIVDPDTDDEGASKPTEILSRTIWVSHAPAWRLSSTNDTLDELDVLVGAKRRKEKVGRGSAFRDRRRGVPRPYDQTTLPRLKTSKKEKPVRIPRSMINQHWLKGKFGVPFDSRGLISGDESDGAAGSGSGEGNLGEDAEPDGEDAEPDGEDAEPDGEDTEAGGTEGEDAEPEDEDIGMGMDDGHGMGMGAGMSAGGGIVWQGNGDGAEGEEQGMGEEFRDGVQGNSAEGTAGKRGAE